MREIVQLLEEYSPQPGCSKLGYNNSGLTWNMISDLKALRGNSVEFVLTTVSWLDALKVTEQKLSEKGFWAKE